jgi:uncharacterized protein
MYPKALSSPLTAADLILLEVSGSTELKGQSMLLVKTYLDKSAIHGLGVFAAETIPKGTKIWRFVEGFDRSYTLKQFARLPKPARDFLKDYAYRVDGEVLFTVDNDHHMNHAEEPNTLLRGGYVIAASDIAKGVEITNDYREFDPALCAAFLKKPMKSKAKPKRAQARPRTSPNRHGTPAYATG